MVCKPSTVRSPRVQALGSLTTVRTLPNSLLVGYRQHLFLHGVELGHLRFQFCQLLLQVRLLQLDRFRRLPPVDRVEPTPDSARRTVSIACASFDLSLREILVTIVDRLEVASIDGHGRLPRVRGAFLDAI